MLKRSLRIKVMAAMFSAAFLLGGISVVNAYTYSGGTTTVDKLAEDENELIVTSGAKVTSTGVLNPSKIKTTTTTVTVPAHYEFPGSFSIHGQNGRGAKGVSLWFNMPAKPDAEAIECFKDFVNGVYSLDGKYKKYITGGPATGGESSIGVGDITPYFGIKNHDGIVEVNLDAEGFVSSITVNGITLNRSTQDSSMGGSAGITDFLNQDTSGGINPDNYRVIVWVDDENYVKETTKEESKTENLGDSSITVQNNSQLIGKTNVETSKVISVTGTSILSAATSITGGTITTDGDIIAEFNYSAPSGKSTISATTITSNGALTASKDIKATTGSISGTVIQATSGNIVANNTIKATGKAKGNVLNVGVINATSASITGNQAISGIFTTTGQAKLNGGATLGGKKITGLSIGTLSTTSTDAVNGKQLYTAMQSSGKTYKAGTDISISSANAISVAKVGKVASGNTGIMTGDAVYQETSKIDATFKVHNASITSNNSKLDNLTTSIESLRKSLGTINSSVSDTISGLPGSLANFANKDLTDLSDTGINTLKSYIKNEVKKQIPSNSKTASYAMEAALSKDTSAVDNGIVSKANASDLTALGSKVDSKVDKSNVSLVEDTINAKADLGYVNDGLAKKADQSAVEVVGRDVDRNTSTIAKNTESTQANTEAISGLNESKADVSGNNIDVSSWSNELGTGTVAKDDTGLVNGSSVASALEKKADIGYVAMGLGAMEGSLEQVNQSVTKDVNRVGAGASALMGLHPTGDKFEFATAYGHYKNSNNTALGVFYKPTANSTVSVVGTIGDGDAMLSAGVSIKLGLNKEVKKVITPEEFGAMKTAVDSQDEKLDQMEKTLQRLMAK